VRTNASLPSLSKMLREAKNSDNKNLKCNLERRHQLFDIYGLCCSCQRWLQLLSLKVATQVVHPLWINKTHQMVLFLLLLDAVVVIKGGYVCCSQRPQHKLSTLYWKKPPMDCSKTLAIAWL